MSASLNFAAEARNESGKGVARALRRAGKIPGVIYGDGKEPQLVSFDAKDIISNFTNPSFMSMVIDIKIGNAVTKALPKVVQLHPVSDIPEHVDFLRIGKNTKVKVHVPVKFINELKSPGIKKGGVLNIVRHDIEMFCSPDNIPELIEIDLNGIEIGHSIHITDIKLPEGVRPTITRNFTVATIVGRTTKDEDAEQKAAAEAAAAAAAATPAAGAAKPGAPTAAGAAAAKPGAAPAAAKPAGKK